MAAFTGFWSLPGGPLLPDTMGGNQVPLCREVCTVKVIRQEARKRAMQRATRRGFGAILGGEGCERKRREDEMVRGDRVHSILPWATQGCQVPLPTLLSRVEHLAHLCTLPDAACEFRDASRVQGCLWRVSVSRKWRWRLKKCTQQVADCHDCRGRVSDIDSDPVSFLSRTQCRILMH